MIRKEQIWSEINFGGLRMEATSDKRRLSLAATWHSQPLVLDLAKRTSLNQTARRATTGNRLEMSAVRLQLVTPKLVDTTHRGLRRSISIH
jgi:hypothetical protein